MSEAAQGRSPPLLVFGGESGIGKTRLLEHLRERTERVGGRCCIGRGFEAEVGRALGVWTDLLRSVPREIVPEELRPELARLLPELGPPAAGATNRAQLFEVVAEVLRRGARDMPLAVVIDDLHWIDDASVALLHYLVRLRRSLGGVVIGCAVRFGELVDNVEASRALLGLRREGAVREVTLAPLSEGETGELVRSVAPSLDGARIFAESEGHPLYALELADAEDPGDRDEKQTLQSLIEGQIIRLDEPSRALVSWASALGRNFSGRIASSLSGLDAPVVLRAFETLERRGVLHALGSDEYGFAHDLVRRAAYRMSSPPRRTLMHREIARALTDAVDTDDEPAGELVRHAELAGDHALAARACAVAGARSLRLFSNRDAVVLAKRGRSHLADRPRDATRLGLLVELFRIEVVAAAGTATPPVPGVAEELTALIAEADVAGAARASSAGHHVLSVLHQASGDTLAAERSTVRAAEAGQGTDARLRGRQLANSARCLVDLERDIPRAEAFLAEAETILAPHEASECEVECCRGLLARWHDDRDAARRALERALALARGAEDRWRELNCLTWLAMLALESERLHELRRWCGEIRGVSSRMGDRQAPIADALDGLARIAGDAATSLAEFDAAVIGLRQIDDKAHLAYCLNAAAAVAVRRGAMADARRYAEGALCLADAMHRPGDSRIAETILLLARDPDAPPGEAAARTRDASEDVTLGARVRAVLTAAADAMSITTEDCRG